MAGEPVLVVGAGPSGLAAAASLKKEGVPFRLVDRRGVAGGAYNEIYSKITLASPTWYTSLPGLPHETASEYTTAAEMKRYLERYAAHFELRPEKQAVQAIRRQGAGFSVKLESGEEVLSAHVVVATGMWDNPVSPVIPGLPPERTLHARDWKGVPPGDEKLLLVGGATAAIEIAEECAKAGRSVFVSTRSGVKILPQRFLGHDLHDYVRFFEMLPRFLVRRHCDRRPTLQGTDLGFKEFVNRGLIVLREKLVRFEGKTAVFADGRCDEVDKVVLATGYGFDMPFLPKEVARATAGHPRAKDNESVTWPGLFFVGTPCARGTSSEFLRGIAQDAPRVAKTIRGRL